ncbi:MAG: MFS transporter [Chitinophagaceae bacterium]|nr:MAG: MFS transporter [Chitinophagaceae bacterium]
MLLPKSLSPLEFVSFRKFIVCRFFLIMALRMVSTVVGYKLFQLTQSSFAIGLVGLSEFIPAFSLSLYAGYRIDRSDKRTLLFRGIFLYAFCVVGLLLLTAENIESRFTPSRIQYLYYAVIFCTGIIRAFVGPTSSAIVAQLIPRDRLQFAANITSSSWLSASILGHATGGFFIAWFGVHNTFFIILGYIIVSAFSIFLVPRLPVVNRTPGAGALASVKEGLVYVLNHKILLGAISLDLFAVLFGGAVALIPEVAHKILAVGPVGFGWLNAATDIGAVMSILLMTIFPLRRKQGKRLLFAVGVFGVCVIAFGVSEVYWISFCVLLLAGMMDAVSMIIRGTIFQLTTPDHMRGRVSSVNSMFINSSNELGMFESGFTSRIMGAAPAIVFGGCMTVIVVFITWLFAPSLRKMEY